MSFYTVIPKIVLFSKLLTDEEKILYSVLTNCIIPEKKYCNVSNEKLAKALNTSERTMTARLESMRKKGFINCYINNHLHQRIIYLNTPLKEGSEEPKPTEEELEPKKELLLEAFKKATILGNIDFETLMQRFIDSPYLAEVKNGDTQFALNEEQLIFLADFKKSYPGKKIDAQLAYYNNINLKDLSKAIKGSEFLSTNDNLTLKWVLENSDDIIAGKYKDYGVSLEFKSNFKNRMYTPDELNQYFQDIDEIEV